MTKSSRLSLACLAVLLSASTLRAAPSPEMLQRGHELLSRLQQGGPVTMVAFGDSLTDGMGTDGRHTFPRLVADCLTYRFPRAQLKLIVQGHPGESTGGALDRVEDDVLKPKPDLVLVQFGGNDKGSGRSVWAFRKDYAELLGRISTETTAVVLACLNPIIDDDPNNPWNEAFREGAAEAGVAAADLDRALREGDHDSRGAFPYSVHPADFTHVLWAHTVMAAFDEATGAVPTFTCALVGGSEVSNSPDYGLSVRLRNLTGKSMAVTTKVDYPDTQDEHTSNLRASASALLRYAIPLTPPVARRSYSLPVHLWTRSTSYGGFDTKWLVVAPAVVAVTSAAEAPPPPAAAWQRFDAESLMFGKHLWLGPRDLGGGFVVLVLPDRLRFLLSVTDDDISVGTLDYPSFGDCAELYLDLRADRDQGKPVYSNDVIALQIIAPTEADQPAQWKAMQELPEDWKGISVQTARTKEGYDVQVDVPLAPIVARRGEYWGGLGFDVGLNDADAGGYRKTQMEWAGTPDNYLYPTYFAGLYPGKLAPGATRRTVR